MKKKAVSALLCAAMVAGMLAGCGKGSDSGTRQIHPRGMRQTQQKVLHQI